MQGVSQSGIEFGRETDQAGRVGSSEFENSGKLRGNSEQAGAVTRLGIDFARSQAEVAPAGT